MPVTTKPSNQSGHGSSPSVVIIGGGLGGLGLALELKARGWDDFALLDRGVEIGGVWRDNRYPNAASDTPIELYAFRHRIGTDWSSNFASSGEILAYIHDLTDAHGLRPHLSLETEVTGAEWDEAAQRWTVHAADGRVWRPKFVVWAGGLLSTPLIPRFPGQESFTGEILHTAHWRDDIDLSGKRVAVVGGGATSIQVTPHAVARADHVVAIVRTPSYVMPKPEVFYDDLQRQQFRDDPGLQLGLRAKWLDIFEGLVAGRFPMKPEIIAKQEEFWREQFEAQIADPAIRAILAPNYRFGCRRPLVSNDYYKAMCQPNVTVLGGSIRELSGGEMVVTDGRRFPIDTLILATGFQPGGMLGVLDLKGRSGRGLSEIWDGCPRAYYGVLVKDFPNFFLVNGPNAGGPVVTEVIASQAKYIATCMEAVGSEGGSVEVNGPAQDRFNAAIQARTNASVMVLGGCSSYYRAGGDGAVFTHWPGTVASLVQDLAEVRFEDLTIRPPVRDRPATPQHGGSRTSLIKVP